MSCDIVLYMLHNTSHMHEARASYVDIARLGLSLGNPPKGAQAKGATAQLIWGSLSREGEIGE